jgi:hypothetical protein
MGVAVGGDATDAYIPAGSTVGRGTGITNNQLYPGNLSGTTIKYKRSGPFSVKVGSTTYNSLSPGWPNFPVGSTTVTFVADTTSCNTYSNCPPIVSVTPSITPSPSRIIR